MLKKFFIKCLYLFFSLVFFSTSVCSATVVTVTNENLKVSLQEFVSSEANEENYNITVSENVINVIVNNESYNLNYDLTEKPTFTLEVSIQKGMSYEDFTNKTDNLLLPMLGYVAVANIQGVKVEDASSYFLLSYLAGAFNGDFSTDSSYTIIDDINVSEGVTIEKTDDPKTIYTSEFGDRVIEYVNNMYKDKQSISDSTGINSYLFSIEKLDSTDTSCKLVSKLTVNTEADFSKIMGYSDDLESEFEEPTLNSTITKDNADLVVTLKVGQKCKIESSEEITGYEFQGYNCFDLNDDKTEITATKVGTRTGYFYVGEEKKSIYVTVEENIGNIDLETITLKIDSEPEIETPEDNKEEQKQEEVKEEPENDESIKEDDNSKPASKLPQTGTNNYIIIIMIILICANIIVRIKLKSVE